MQRLKPVSIHAEGRTSYRVHFEDDRGPIEYVFNIDESGSFPVVVSDHNYLNETLEDPKASCLLQAISLLHAVRS